MLQLLKKMWGNTNEREIKRLMKKVEKINALESQMERLSDEELRNKTEEYKRRYQEGETLEHLLPEAFATVREASKRVMGMRHFDVQLIGGMVLHEGNISEMRTGEGKTLVSTLPAYLNALTGKGVHIVTVNDYLAKRDSEEMGKLHQFLGLTVGLNVNMMEPFQKKEAYACDITYGTNSEFGFDFLRDNMVSDLGSMVQRPLHYAIIDEVDSILIDEARTPLIISGQSDKPTQLYYVVAHFVRHLKPEEDFTIDVKTRNIAMTDQGIEKVERAFNIQNLYDLEHVSLNHHIQNALRAEFVMKQDVDYVVRDEEIMIVDENTGRIMKGRRYGNGLHQALEAKEGLPIQPESKTLATITIQNYFRMYEKLAGMTGTAKTEEEELKKIYGLEVIVVPTHRPIARIDHPDMVYKTKEYKHYAILQEIQERHQKEQPVLVGTTSVENSEYLSSLLSQQGIPHQVLNAKNHEQEAEIVALAGQKGAVTIATNMAGRGTDIKLGEGVQELGGLCIIGTERHESRRIDNQLRGRAGRQGDPGESCFIISLEDELMRRFGGEQMIALMNRMKMEDDIPIVSSMVSKAIESAQKRVEGSNFDARKYVLQYDDVLNQQRKIIYGQRKQVLDQSHVRHVVLGMMKRVMERVVDGYCPVHQVPEEWDLEGLKKELERLFLEEDCLSLSLLKGKEKDEIIDMVQPLLLQQYEEKENINSDIVRHVEKMVILQTVDHFWLEHMDAMDHLRQGIHLRSYAQTDPLYEYQKEGFQFFEAMIQAIETQVSSYMAKFQIQVAEPSESEEEVIL